MIDKEINIDKKINYNYSQQELGCVLKLKLTSKQKTKINQFTCQFILLWVYIYAYSFKSWGFRGTKL